MHTVLNLLGKDYRATDMQPGYAAMRDALQADLPLLEAIRIEVEAANVCGNSARVRGALELMLRALETYEAAGGTFKLDAATPAAVRHALSLPRGTRRSALALLSRDDADFALTSIADMVQKFYRSNPLRFVDELPEVDEKRFQERSRSGFRGTATAGTKSHSPRLRHGAIIRN